MLTSSGSGRTDLITLEIAACVLGMSLESVHGLVQSGELDVVEIAGLVRVVRADVAALWARTRDHSNHAVVH
jgi:hypothetical protein